MTSSDEEREPSPEQLAAFLDGEYEHLGNLSPDRIERWLKRHPQAAEQARTQRRLSRVWQNTSPEEPAADEWRRVLCQIERRLQDPSRPRPRPWRWWGGAVGLLVATAASVALVVSVARRPIADPFTLPVDPPGQVSSVVLPIVSDDEVEILSVRGVDVESLVVGVMPMHGTLVLADPGEVSLIRSNPAVGGKTIPGIRMNDAETPMVWPTASVESKQTPSTP
jgi:hypothetical protein